MHFSIRPLSDSRIWEQFITRYAPQSLFQSWTWGEVQKLLRQRVWRYGLYEKDTLVGIFQIILIKAKRGIFLHVRHGPIFAQQEQAYWHACIDHWRIVAKKEHALFIRCSPLLLCSSTQQTFFESLGFRPAPIHAMDAERCWVLDIDAADEELLSAMRKTTRYEIRHAMKMGVTVTKSHDSKDLIHFMHLYEETSSRHGFVGHKGIKEEFDLFGKTNDEVLFLAFYQGRVIAAALVMFYNNQAIYHHGASITSKVPASHIIQWEAIKEAKKRGMKLYNFWGIAPENDSNHPWSGITLFKKGFGGREIQYIHAQDYPMSPLYIVPKAVESIRKMLKGY